jgi:hypothetical protein
MPLVNCPECKNQVSDSARACPHCGIGLKKCCGIGTAHGSLVILPIMFLCLVAFVFLLIFCSRTVNMNSNNGFINFHNNKRGIFPSLRFTCRCGRKG